MNRKLNTKRKMSYVLRSLMLRGGESANLASIACRKVGRASEGKGKRERGEKKRKKKEEKNKKERKR